MHTTYFNIYIHTYKDEKFRTNHARKTRYAPRSAAIVVRRETRFCQQHAVIVNERARKTRQIYLQTNRDTNTRDRRATFQIERNRNQNTKNAKRNEGKTREKKKREKLTGMRRGSGPLSYHCVLMRWMPPNGNLLKLQQPTQTQRKRKRKSFQKNSRAKKQQ